MGQYHCVYNITKKEFISPHALDCGAKLLEAGGLYTTGLMLLLCNSNGRGGGDLYVEREYNKKTFKPKPLKGQALLNQQAINLVAGRWAGDQIVVQGDYAKDGDPALVSGEEMKDYKNISTEVFQALMVNDYFREESSQSKKLRPDMIVYTKVQS